MADKPKPIPFNVYRDESEPMLAAEAKAALRPSAQAAHTLRYFNPFFGGDSAGKTDPNEIAAELQRHATDASANNLTRYEAMLANQAHTLDAIFNNMARLAALNRGEYMDAMDRYMRLALKAQSQCRATIESLAEMKNPKSFAFVQQANIAAGPQQVNNGERVSGPVRAGARARAGDSVQSNELLEGGDHGNRVERGPAEAGIKRDLSMASMGQVDRP